jgi:tetratricopeptide (TPR) repeat protein
LPPEIRASIDRANDEAASHPEKVDAVGRLAMLLHAHGRLEPAAAAYEQCRALDPKSFRWAYYLGTVQTALGNHGGAAATLREAAKLKPDYVPARLKLAQALLDSGSPAESREIYLSLLETGNKSASILYGLGRSYESTGNRKAAMESYERALAIYPSYGAANYALALAYRDAGRPEDSKRHMTLFRTNQNSGPPGGDPVLGELDKLRLGPGDFLSEGVRLSAEGRLDEAAAAFERALERAPDNLLAHANMISVYGRKGDYRRAEAHFQQACVIDAESVDVLFNWGVVLARQQKYGEAAQAFRKVLSADPRHPDANTNLGYLKESEGDAKEASRLYHRALESEPRHPEANFRLGRLYLTQRQPGPAIGSFQQASKANFEQRAEALYGLAAAFAMSGDLKRAVSSAGEALREARAAGRSDLVPLIEDDLRRFEGAGPGRK